MTDHTEDFLYCDLVMRVAMDPDGSVTPADNLGRHVMQQARRWCAVPRDRENHGPFTRAVDKS
jgi:hypothetical protein